MTYNEALQLLELKSGFTKEELNKNYKRLMRRWHPDICNASNAEEMAKKLNEAKEILSEKNNNNDNFYNENVYYNNDPKLKIKKEEYVNKIRSIFKNVDKIKINGESTNLFILEILFMQLQAILDINNAQDMETLENNYHYYDDYFRRMLIKYILLYCLEESMYFENLDKYICMIEDESINIENKDIYEIHEEIERINKKRNFMKRAINKIKKMF